MSKGNTCEPQGEAFDRFIAELAAAAVSVEEERAVYAAAACLAITTTAQVVSV